MTDWTRSHLRFYAVSSNTAFFHWKSTFNKDGQATVIEITAQPNDIHQYKFIQKVESNYEMAQFDSLTPFTWYKFIVKEKDTDTLLAEIGPIRTWPSGKY